MTKIIKLSALMRGTAAAALLALPLGGAALAQEQQPQQGQPAQPAQQQEQSAQPAQQQGQTAQQGGTAGGAQDAQQQTAGGTQPAGDAAGQSLGAGTIVATVGDVDISGDDVMRMIGQLPEPLRAQQPDMLVPIALDQLIMRELILQEAERENLGEDPEVVALVEQSSADARDDAMVHVWLRREFDEAVNDESARQFYDELAMTSAEELPPFEQVRPQIDQHLRQQTLGEIRNRLGQNAEVTLYGPGGQPIEQPAGAASGTASGGGGTGGQSTPEQGQAAAEQMPDDQGESQAGTMPENQSGGEQGTSSN